MAHVVVLGAGASGLSSALRLLEQGHEVELWATAFSPNTTSDVAATMWWPFHAEPADKVRSWCMASYGEFERLADDPLTGVVMHNGMFGFETEDPPQWTAAIPGARSASPDQLPPGCLSRIEAFAPMIE